MAKENGLNNVGVAYITENDENCDRATAANLVDKKVEHPNLTSNNEQIVLCCHLC